MAIVHRTGFDGVWTSADYANTWASQPSHRVGMDVVASSGKSVSVGVGNIFAFGGSWSNTVAATVTLTTPPSGTRWDLIALRVNYSAKTGTLVAIAHSSLDSMTIPPAANTAIGALYDIPLAFVENDSGSSGVGRIVAATLPVYGGSAARLLLTGTQSAASSNYRSLSWQIDPDNFSDLFVSFTGHVFSLPPGAYRIGGQISYSAENDTTASGRRGAGISLDPSANTWNADAVPGNLKILSYNQGSASEVSVVIPQQRYDVLATTKILPFARQTAGETLNVLDTTYKTFINIEKIS